MQLMTEEQKGSYLEALATERKGYEARLVGVAGDLDRVGDDPATPDGKVRRQELLNMRDCLQGRLDQVAAELKRVKGLRAARAG